MAYKKELGAAAGNEVDRSPCIMACGLTGAGKSTLLNAICGSKVFKERDLKSCTFRVDRVTKKKGYIFCDTPGFADGLGNEGRYLEEIKKECASVDTFFYCISLNSTRIKMEDDLATLKNFSSVLDKRIWNHCVVVLTFANMLIRRIKDSGIESQDEIKTEYSIRMEKWKRKVQETFRSAGIDPTNMPIVSAGKAEDGIYLFPNDQQSWLANVIATVHYSRPKSLCVMACGLTGAGKSALLNAICGSKVFKECDLKSCTFRVNRVTKKKGYILCDTPGFADGLGKEDRYLEEIKKECANVDIFFYCISLNSTRIKMKDDLATIEKFSSALGKRIWNHCVIVLTFANMLISRIKDEDIESQDEIKTKYSIRIEEWKRKVQETFRSAGIDPTNMPIVSAGKAEDGIYLFPNDQQSWLANVIATVHYSRPKSLCVMACGLTGAGKSALLNGFCGEKAFQVGHYTATTSTVETYTIEKENYRLTLCDTPGFKDESGNEDEYLEMITKKCADVDTLLYCIPVHYRRIRMKDDLATLQKLHAVLDKRVWNHCVIVFTFANELIDKVKNYEKETLDKIMTASGSAKNIEKRVQQHIHQTYNERIELWKAKVLETFRKAGINPDKIPIVEAGCAKTPLLFPTDTQPWVSTYWEAVSDVSYPDGQAVLFNICFSNYNCAGPLYAQKIVLSKQKETSREKFPTIAAAVGVGGTTGVVGAGIGATIGALAIGIPTFGVAAGVGLLLGGLIGGGIGTGVGAAAGTIVKKARDSKK